MISFSKNNALKGLIFIPIVIFLYHFGDRWWARHKVNQLIFVGLNSAQIPADVRKRSIEEKLVNLSCSNDENGLRLFLRAGYFGSAKNENGVTALHCAAAFGNLNLVKDLIGAKADVRAGTSQDGLTPIHYAAAHHEWDVMRFLLKKGASIEEPSKQGSPLMWFAKYQFRQEYAEYRYLMHVDVKPKKETKEKQQESFSASVAILKSLGAKLDSVAPDGNTLMHFSALAQDIPLMESLASSHQLSANTKNNHGETPLITAFHHGAWMPKIGNDSHIKTVKWLLKNGVDMNARDDTGWSIALTRTAISMKLNFLALFPGLDINVADNTGSSIWDTVASPADLAKSQKTIAVPLMLNGQAGNGPLHYAVINNSFENINYLLQRGVDPNQINQDGMSPFHQIFAWRLSTSDDRKKFMFILNAMLDAGADVNKRTTKGFSPLMLAVDQPGEIIQCLIEHKAGVNATFTENSRVLSILDYFVRRSNTAGIEVLLKAGATGTDSGKTKLSTKNISTI